LLVAADGWLDHELAVLATRLARRTLSLAFLSFSMFCLRTVGPELSPATDADDAAFVPPNALTADDNLEVNGVAATDCDGLSTSSRAVNEKCINGFK